MTKITGDIEEDYRRASADGRRAIVEKLQRYIDRGLWAQSIMHALPLPGAEGRHHAAGTDSNPDTALSEGCDPQRKEPP